MSQYFVNIVLISYQNWAVLWISVPNYLCHCCYYCCYEYSILVAFSSGKTPGLVSVQVKDRVRLRDRDNLGPYSEECLKLKSWYRVVTAAGDPRGPGVIAGFGVGDRRGWFKVGHASEWSTRPDHLSTPPRHQRHGRAGSRHAGSHGDAERHSRVFWHHSHSNGRFLPIGCSGGLSSWVLRCRV